MKFKKIYNEHVKCYDIELKEKENTLKIFFAGNLDLYLMLSDGEVIDNENFNITKENYEIFSIFESLYKEIINGEVFDNDDFDDIENNYKFSDSYKKLVKENQITWISDNGPVEMEDRFVFYPLDENTYHFLALKVPLELVSE